MSFRILFILALFLGASLHAGMNNESPVQLSLVAESNLEEKRKSLNEPIWVAIALHLAPGWHLSWINPGDAGFTPTIEWTLPDGFAVDAIEWPYPKKFSFGEIDAFGYENEVILLARLKPKKDAMSPFEIALNIRFVACNDSTCMPGESQAKIIFPLQITAEQTLQQKALFERARGKMAEAIPSSSFERREGRLSAQIFLPKAEVESEDIAYFCPSDLGVDHRKIAVSLSPKDDENQELALLVPEDMPLNQLKGVVITGKKAYSVDFSSQVVPVSEEGGESFFLLIVFAFLGGLILNAMPCVLPVISLKMVAIAKMAKEKQGDMAKDSFFYTAGVVLSFWLLFGLLWLLRSLGESVGWGFQLQEPIFVALLAMLFFALALSLFGVFEMGLFVASWAGEKKAGVHSASKGGAFFSGVLATLVATPCTGPFLGTAIGVAFTLSFMEAFSLFTMIALGMAFPFILIPLFPGAIGLLPKPGAWMETFKQLMGFVMMASVLWLLWVFSAQTGMGLLFLLLFSLLVIGLAFWILGRFGTPVSSKRVRLMATAIFVVVAGAAIYIPVAAIFQGQEAPSEAFRHGDDVAWEPYSRERVEALRKEGKPVFIDFTAKWCLICQVNHLLLNHPDLQTKFESKNIVRMKADYTQKDSQIGAELARWGRGGVPLYLLLHGDADDEKSVILPQLLTVSAVAEAIDSL